MNKKMLTLSNTISLLRGPLALLFFFQSVKIRIAAIIAAMISDWIDGYLARKFKSETFLGKVLDPVMDKFFVFFVLAILTYQSTITPFQLLAFLSRDFAIILYWLTTLVILGPSKLVYFPAYASKVTTLLQFVTLLSVVLLFQPPMAVFYLFIALAPIVYIELMITTFHKSKKAV